MSKIYVVGIGPGAYGQMTIDAAEALKNSDVIIGYTVYYWTDEPEKTGYYKAKYRVATSGKDYLKWEYDDEDGGAGDDVNGVDRLQIKLEKAHLS